MRDIVFFAEITIKYIFLESRRKLIPLTSLNFRETFGENHQENHVQMIFSFSFNINIVLAAY